MSKNRGNSEPRTSPEPLDSTHPSSWDFLQRSQMHPESDNSQCGERHDRLHRLMLSLSLQMGFQNGRIVLLILVVSDAEPSTYGMTRRAIRLSLSLCLPLP